MELDPEQRDFVRLLTQTERRLRGYVLSLVPNLNDADEILQETNIRLWEERSKYRPGSDFAAWALRVAYYEVLTWRKRKGRRRTIFDEELVAELAVRIEHSGPSVDRREWALLNCLSELSDGSRTLLQGIYGEGKKIKELAEHMDRTAGSVYKTVQRLRTVLRGCIEQRLAEEELAS